MRGARIARRTLREFSQVHARRLPSCFGALTLLVALGLPRVAAADLQAKDFEWDAPPECPSRASVLETMRGITRTDVRDSPHVSATVTGPPWQARVIVDRAGERGDRRLEASSCEALAHAVALVAALSIDRAEQAPPPAPPSPPPPPPVVSPPAEPRDAPSPVPARDGQRFALVAGVTMRTGLAPATVPGVEAGPAFRLGALELSTRVALFVRSLSRVPEGAGSFFLATGEARAAWVYRVTPASALVPHAGLALAYLRGEGRGAVADEHAEDWLPLPYVGLEGRANLGAGFEGYLGVDAGLPLGRSVFRFHGPDAALHEPSLVSTRMSLGLRLALF